MIGCWRATIKLSPYLLISAPSMSSPSHSDALLEAKHRLERFKAHQRQRSSDRFHCRQNVVQILDQDENLSLLSNSWSAPSALGGAVATASSAAAPSSVPLSSSLPSDGGAQYLNQHNDDPRYNGEQNKPSTRSSIVDAEALPSPPLPLPLPPVLLTSSSSSPSPVLSTSLSAPAATSIATHAQGLPAHEEHRRRHHCRPRDGPTRRIFTRFRGAAGHHCCLGGGCRGASYGHALGSALLVAAAALLFYLSHRVAGGLLVLTEVVRSCVAVAFTRKLHQHHQRCADALVSTAKVARERGGERGAGEKRRRRGEEEERGKSNPTQCSECMVLMGVPLFCVGREEVGTSED